MNPGESNPTVARLRLDFYNTAVLMSRWEDDGRLATYPVSVHDVVGACTNVQLSSGLLASQHPVLEAAGQSGHAGHLRAGAALACTNGRPKLSRTHAALCFVGYGSSIMCLPLRNGRLANMIASITLLPQRPYSRRHLPGNTLPHLLAAEHQTALTLFLEGSLFNADLEPGASAGLIQKMYASCGLNWTAVSASPLSELVPAQMTLWNLV